MSFRIAVHGASLLLVLAALLVPPSPAGAQSAVAMRKQVEASMLVTGTVDIGADGRVVRHALDHPDSLPPPVVDLLARAVPSLAFEPVVVDGRAVVARARMSVRVVAKPEGDDMMTITTRGFSFGDPPDVDGKDTSQVSRVEMKPPHYPMTVAAAGGKGDVYVIVKVARDGSVADVHAEQVNLTAIGSAQQMASVRKSLTKAALTAARKWRFAPPTTGDHVDGPFWYVRVPVAFKFRGDALEPKYGQWEAYHPGQWTPAPWSLPQLAGFTPDALPPDGIYGETPKFRLRQPPPES